MTTEQMVDEHKKAQEEKKEQVAVNDTGHLAKIKVGDVEYKVVNSVEVISIMVHKLENGKEISQVIAHEFMMADHKRYMVELLTQAINTVMKAEKRKSILHMATQAVMNRINRERNKKQGRGFGK